MRHLILVGCPTVSAALGVVGLAHKWPVGSAVIVVIVAFGSLAGIILEDMVCTPRDRR